VAVTTPPASVTPPAAVPTAETAAPRDFNFTIEGRGNSRYVKITKYIGSKPVLAIPGTINGLPVTSIGKRAFEPGLWYTKVTTVVLPSGLTDIEEQAFMNSAITEIVIPPGVTRIGAEAFASCTGLKSITLPQTITSVGNRAFSKCTGLDPLVRAELQSRFGNRAF
jgi:hypothetical protein